MRHLESPPKAEMKGGEKEEKGGEEKNGEEGASRRKGTSTGRPARRALIWRTWTLITTAGDVYGGVSQEGS